MKEVQISANKLVSHAAGVGSILETASGAFKIEPFNEWPFMRGKIGTWQERCISDDRLLDYLKQHFPKLAHLVEVPWETLAPNQHARLYATASLFPQWMYCPGCDRLQKASDWYEFAYHNKLKGVTDIEDYFIKHDAFCGLCLQNKNGFRRLVQMPYVLVRADGAIDDVPWDRWSSLTEAQTTDDDSSSILQIFGEPCCDKPVFSFKSKGSELSNTHVSCSNCSNRRSLMGLFSDMYAIQQGERPYLIRERTNNNLYSPICVTGIYVPGAGLSLKTKDYIKKRYEKNITLEDIIDNLQDSDPNALRQEVELYYTQLASSLSSDATVVQMSQQAFKAVEFQTLSSASSNDKELIMDRIETDLLGMENLVAVKRLRLTTAQIAYTRLNALTAEEVMFPSQDGSDNNTRSTPHYTSKNGTNTDRLPVAVAYGEGIFFSLNLDHVNQLVSSLDVNDRILTAIVQDNNLRHLGLNELNYQRFILLHTLTHMLMKELEFTCGYPTASLSERLYVSESMCGALIYTTNGGDASYGGLVSQSENFEELVKSALERAESCSADPVCAESEEFTSHQTNGAACYACALVPETSCEIMNTLLDRNLLKDLFKGD